MDRILYKCIHCKVEQKFNLASYAAHLDFSHSNLKETDKSELLKDLKTKISRYNVKQKRRAEKKKKAKKHKLTKEGKEAELNEFKEKIFLILEKTDINPKMIELIKSRNKIEKIKRILNSSIKEEYKNKIKDAEIDIYVSPKKKNKKKPQNKNFNDKSKNYLKLIYTPMGNKR